MNETVALLPALGFGSVFLLVIGIQRTLDRRTSELSRRLSVFAPATDAPAERAARVAAATATGSLRRQRRRFSSIGQLDRALSRNASFAERLDNDLARAALPIRVGEYLLLRWGLAMTLGLAAAGLAGTLLVAPIAGAVGYVVPALYVRQRQNKRTRLLDEQLVDAMALIAGGLKAGYSFLQGIEAVVRELPPPIGEELKSVLEDLRIGVPMEEALVAFARRAPTEDVDMMVTAMLVQRSSGGNLAEVLENIGRTVRERIRIRREVMTLTAQERMSSYVVGALPIVAFVFLTMFNPDYLNLLFDTPTGKAMLAGAVVLELIGFYIVRRIVDIRL